MTDAEALTRDQIVASARSLFDRGLTHGSTGNISVRLGETILVTPTGSSLGTVEMAELSMIDLAGTHIGGPPPSKEAFLHAAMLRARPDDSAVVHTHSTYSTAVSCLDGLDISDALPPLTAYFAMRVGRVARLPYHAPGDGLLGPLAEQVAASHSALLLSNHGPLVAGLDLSSAMDALEELEETAKLFLILQGHSINPITSEEAERLRGRR